MTEEAETKLAKARALLRMKAPYMMRTIYGLIPVMVEGLNTLGVTESMVLILDPAWVSTLPEHKIAAALLHEGMHVVRDHLPRMAPLPNRDLANIAGDLSINPELRAAGWELPHGVFPEDYGFPEGRTMEEYYALLEKWTQDRQQKGQQGSPKKDSSSPASPGKGNTQQPGGGSQVPKSSQGSSGKGTGSTPGPSSQGSSARPQDGKAKSPGGDPGQGQQGGSGSALPDGKHQGVCAGRCGGVAHNPVSPIEKKINEEVGRSEADQRRIVKQTIEDIKEHAAQHGRGSVPGSLLQAIDQAETRGEVPWNRELQHIMKRCTGRLEAGGVDFSLARPSKRSFARGFPRPGLVQYLPEVALVLDTSASMGTEQIQGALAEAVGIFRGLGIDHAWFLQADANVAKNAVRVSLRDFLGRVQIHGRGGTNFDPALRALEKLKPRPDIAVYLTDGDGRVSHRPKGIEVVWCIVRSDWSRKPPCDWGHCVFVSERGKAPTRRTA